MNKQSKLFLKKQPAFTDFQKYVQQMEEERGFTEQGVLQKCLMPGEEVGELFKAIRKKEKTSCLSMANNFKLFDFD